MGSKSELLNVLGEIKARLQDKFGLVDLPMPQFILIGKQSTGKSRLIEALAGETFNFISGTLGSRRPTVLEFRNAAGNQASRWYVRDMATNQWVEHPIQRVMKLVGDAHEELGETVSADPIYVRIASPVCVDMQIVDLPGFRDFALDLSKAELSKQITELVTQFMADRRNVMLCVEQANDAATMSTLARCKEIDPKFERTVLIRNKLDKYYDDLTPQTVGKWVEGYGDLPEGLVRFALTLPFWKEGSQPPKALAELRRDMNREDIRQMTAKGLSKTYMQTIGFQNFASFMEVKIESMFVEAIGPVLQKLREWRTSTERREQGLKVEHTEIEISRILSTTRECGVSFATALNHVMSGVIGLSPAVTLEAELREFHKYHQAAGSSHVAMLPSNEFAQLPDYIEYLRNDIQIPSADVELNGGAQFRRLMVEVEIFLRFSEINVEIRKQDVIQARGVLMGSGMTWREVVLKLLSKEAHVPLQRRLHYVGERIKWFFKQQKEAVIQFMSQLEGSPCGSLYSPLYPKHARLIMQNNIIKDLVFKTYDDACQRQLEQFLDLFNSMLNTTFSNPWVFLKSVVCEGNPEAEGEAADDTVLPSFEDTKERIPKEIQARSQIEATLCKWLQDIPIDDHQVDLAVDKVQMLVLKTYSFIRAQVCDQVELFSESFFKLPMLRRLEENMALLELSDVDKGHWEARRHQLADDIRVAQQSLVEINACIDRLKSFKAKCDARSTAA